MSEYDEDEAMRADDVIVALSRYARRELQELREQNRVLLQQSSSAQGTINSLMGRLANLENDLRASQNETARAYAVEAPFKATVEDLKCRIAELQAGTRCQECKEEMSRDIG